MHHQQCRENGKEHHSEWDQHGKPKNAGYADTKGITRYGVQLIQNTRHIGMEGGEGECGPFLSQLKAQ